MIKRFILPLIIFTTIFASACTGGDLEATNATTQSKTDLEPKMQEQNEVGQREDGIQFMKVPAIIYTTTGEENELGGTDMYVFGTVAELTTVESYDGIYIETNNGTLFLGTVDEINDLETPDGYVGFHELAVGDTGEFYFMYSGYSTLTETPSGIFYAADIKEPAEETKDIKSDPPETTDAKDLPDVEEPGIPIAADSVTTGQRNAYKAAVSYLSFMPFSYEGLIDQLEYEGYSHDEAIYGVDNCDADWDEQALKKAKIYLNTTSFSYSGLISQLEYEQFTNEQATYAANNCGADWNEQAAKSAKQYMEFSSFSRDSLIDQLEYEGFSYEEAVYGVEANGY